MAEPTLSDVMAKLVAMETKQVRIELEQREQTALLVALVNKGKLIMSNLDTANAALEAINAATSQEAVLLQANIAKLDAVQALITDLVNTAGVPQAFLDKAAQIQAALSGVVDATTAQSSRLDQIATDPRNPVPVSPPAI
jgi:hypothetical protein